MTVHRGDCVEVMAGMEPDSVDAICTDPPYGLEFMGKEWDRLFDARANGGFVNAGSKTSATGTSRPRMMGPSYQAGAAAQTFHAQWAAAALRVARPGAYLLAFGGTRTVHRMTCALEDAGWVIRDMLVWAYAQGFPKSRASLKPAWEPIVMARKPGPLRDLNIEGARIGTTKDVPASGSSVGSITHGEFPPRRPEVDSGFDPNVGRWPANVILTDPILDGGWEGVVGGGETGRMPSSYVRDRSKADQWQNSAYGLDVPEMVNAYGDTGTYSRFFLIPKAPTRERVLSDGRRSPHPTQKPEALIRHLVTLVTPPGGLVLDPFLGSGTLGVVCDGLGMRWAGIEREPEYAQWAEDRIADRAPEWAVA